MSEGWTRWAGATSHAAPSGSCETISIRARCSGLIGTWGKACLNDDQLDSVGSQLVISLAN
jgi:hypothetical protein